MSALKSLRLSALLSVGLFTTGCMVTTGLTDEEQEVRSNLDSTAYMPSAREMRDNIETQELFAQAAFWSREYELNPSDLEATIKLASAVRRLGNPGRAIEITQMGRAIYPRDPYLGAEFAASLIAAERAPEAMETLDQMLAIAPGYARLWSLKGAALDQAEKYDLARKHYARAMQITPNDPNVLTNIGLSYALAGDAATAEGWLRRAADMPGASPAVQQNLELVLKLQGKSLTDSKVASAPIRSAPQMPVQQNPQRTTAPQTQPNVLDRISRSVQPQAARPMPQAPQGYAPQGYRPPAGYPQQAQQQMPQPQRRNVARPRR
ncbi:tetratricopeptide repeat protein [Litorimonas sp. RW-G-Af-16]|uniref:tetratricopeptide repeat protein n=1 Tax=Litorimonas sp. RW-G-Af-16 TaxID=3241168 RepID=UPI00390CC93E